MILWKKTEVEVIEGSIVELEADAIVNAANSTLAGGGVDGAIHRAARPSLKAACLELPTLRPGVRCEPGEVKVTPAFALRAQFVFHTVGPVWRSGEDGEPEVLARCYRTCLVELEQRCLDSIAVPAISTGAYGYPSRLAAKVAAAEVRHFALRRANRCRVVFSVLGASMVRHLQRALTEP